ncbi:retrovirus-related pol polyprotein from transposon TNT 1-94 [Tanacetum coccineum]
MSKDLKKFQAELDRYHDANYASKVEIDCAKARGILISYKMSSEKSFNKYTQKINDLNQMISEIKKKLITHQETITIMLQEKESQQKFYNTREDKEIEKVIALKNKVKVLDDIVYKTGQSVQTMNMLNHNCCYNDNLALMLAPESDETIRLAQESRSKLNSLAKTDFSKSKSVTTKNVSNDFSKPVTAQILPQNVMTIFKNTNVIAPGIVIPTTSVSRPQLKSNQLEDRVMLNNSQGRKQEVTSNVNFVCVTCGKYVLNDNHDMCVLHYINGMNSRTKIPMAVSISTRGHKRTVNQFVATPLKRTVASDSTNQKPRHTTRKLYEHVNLEVHCLEVQCYIRDLKGNDLLTGSRGTDLYSITLQDTSTPNPICLMAKASSSQAWLWHRRLSHLNFDTINLLSKYDIVTGLPKLKFVKDHLCSSCELGKAKRKSFHTKTTPSSKRRLQLLYMDLCGPIRVESINGNKYVLVIVDDYSRYTSTQFLRSKDETPKVLIDFLRLVQKGLHA